MPFRPDENTVEVPAAYCGVADDVRKVVRRQVRAVVRGVPWLEATAGPMVSTRDVPGLIYLHGPTFSGTPKTPQIYLYMPFLELVRAVEKGQVPFERLAKVRDDALGSLWGTAAMLGGVGNLRYVHEWPECAPDLLRIGVEKWDALDGEGPRYAFMTEQGHRFWEVAGGIHFALRIMGVTDYPKGFGIVFEPPTFLAEHGLLDRVMAATVHP